MTQYRVTVVVGGFTHLFQHSHFLLNLVLDKADLSLLTVGYHLEHRLRHHNHVPIVVTYLGIEVTSSLCIAVCIFKGQYLGIRIECLCTGDKLSYGSVLHNNHRFACCSKTAHFHCCAYKGVGLSCSYLMSKHQRLCRRTDNGFCLVRTQLEWFAINNGGCTSEMLRHKIVGNFLWYAIVEQFIIDTFHAFRHFGVALHLTTRPVFEVLAYLVNLVGTSHRRLFVHNGLCGLAASVACGNSLGNADTLAGDSSFDKFMSENGLVTLLTDNTHCLVLLGVRIVWLTHYPCTTCICQLHVKSGALLYEIFI